MEQDFQIENLEDKYILTINKNAVDQNFFIELMDRIRIEYLVEKANLSPDFIQELSTEIKQNWWKQNKQKIMKKINDENYR